MGIRLFTPGMDSARDFPITVGTVIAAYLDHQEQKRRLGKYSKAALELCRSTLEDFANAFGGMSAADLQQTDLVDWIISHPGWVSPHTQSHRAGFVVTCFKWAVKRGDLDVCRISRDSSDYATMQPREAITPEECAAMIRATRTAQGTANRRGRRRAFGTKGTRRAFRWVLMFLWATGARTCEAREMKWADLDLERGLILLRINKTSRSTGESRTIILTNALCRCLRRLRRRLNPHPQGRILLNGRGRPWTRGSLGRQFRRYAAVAHVRAGVTAYSLRHGFCVRALDAGLGERQIADLMGHASTKYVSWYGRSAGRRVDYLRGLLGELE
jgi:integrase